MIELYPMCAGKLKRDHDFHFAAQALLRLCQQLHDGVRTQDEMPASGKDMLRMALEFIEACLCNRQPPAACLTLWSTMQADAAMARANLRSLPVDHPSHVAPPWSTP